MFAQAFHRFYNMMCVILNGTGVPHWLQGIHGKVLFLITFEKSIQYSCYKKRCKKIPFQIIVPILLICFVVVVEQRGLHNTYQHTVYTVTKGNSTHVHHINKPYNIQVAAVYFNQVVISYGLVQLYRRTLKADWSC